MKYVMYSLLFLATLFSTPVSTFGNGCEDLSRLQRIEAIKTFLNGTELDTRSPTYLKIAGLVRKYDIGVFREPSEFLEQITDDDMAKIAGDPELSDTFWRILIERSSGFRNSLIDRLERPSFDPSRPNVPIYTIRIPN